MPETARILWSRLDQPGSDACHLRQTGDGWRIEGCAAFAQGGVPALLAYAVDCDPAWRTRRASLGGWSGDRTISLVLRRDPGGSWTCDGSALPLAQGLSDLDLGFTPATNTNAIRRLDLDIGARAEVTALWFDIEDLQLKRLDQTYERTGPESYAYSSPAHGFRAVLRTGAGGLVEDYPGLWQAVAPAARNGG